MLDKEKGETLLQARLAVRSDGVLSQFMPLAQRLALAMQLRGEERYGIAEVVSRVAQTCKAMHKTYDQAECGDESVVHLHYFAGATDAWITERDSDPDGAGQTQAFGLITLTGNREDAELGYISIKELIGFGVELDLYWTPKTLKEVQS